jgi:integrase
MRKLEDFLSTQHNIKPTTKESYRKAIKFFDASINREFEDCYLDSQLVHLALDEMQKNYAESTWNTWLICLKRYAKYLFDPDDLEAPKLWKKIKPIKIDWEEKLKHKWFSEEEFMRLLDKVDYVRDKAMYGVAVEGALRPGELLALKIGDCKPAPYGFDVTVSGKTGTGSFPVVLFAPLLRQWLNLHRHKHNKEASLWPTKRIFNPDETESESQFMATLDFQRYAKAAGITRKVSLHILRHTKISWTAKNTKVGVSDEMAKKMFRWTKNSRMYARYSHLFGVDSKKTFLALAGVKDEATEKPSVLAISKCLNCSCDNSVGSMFCGSCGFPLNEEAANELLERRQMQEDLRKMQAELTKLMQEYIDKKKDSL